MLKLDNNLLDELGLGSLGDDQKKAMLQHIYETLELRVGTDLANQMTDQQLEEFEKFIDDGGDANQAQALQWLETNLPNYKQVVNQVFEALKVEIRQMAPQIVATSAQQPAVPATTAPAPSYQQPAMGGQPGIPTDPYAGYQQPAPAQGAYPQQPMAPQGMGQGMGPMSAAPVVDPAGFGTGGYQPAPGAGGNDPQAQQPQAQGMPGATSMGPMGPAPQFPQQQPPAGPGGYSQQGQGGQPMPPQYPPAGQ